MTLRAWTFLLIVRGKLIMEFPDGRTHGWVADFGTEVKQQVTWPLAHPENPYGCNGTDTIQSDAMLVVKRGECYITEKAAFAQSLQVAGLMVVDDEGSTAPLLMSGDGETYTFPIIGVPYRKSVFTNATVNSCTALVYVDPIVDPSEIILALFATAIVVLTAFLSTQDLRATVLVNNLGTQAPRRSKYQEMSVRACWDDDEIHGPSTIGCSKEHSMQYRSLTNWQRNIIPESPSVSVPPNVAVINGYSALMFVTCASLILIILFFFMNYVIHFLLVIFCVCGTSIFQEMLEPAVAHCIPRLKAQVWRGVQLSGLVAAIPPIALATMFMIYRNDDQVGWIFQNTIAVGFICRAQKNVRLPSIKIATIGLVLVLCYDVFWVFISPMLFQKSVMSEVATGGSTGESFPFVLKIPSIQYGFPYYQILGFGDITLPGHLVSYLLRRDTVSKQSGWQGYFWPVVFAYLVGLMITMVAMRITQMGQPALLYLVPSCLGTTLVLGYMRNDLTNLWRGRNAKHGHEF